ncbi:MAG: N-6 DNA methylase [Bacteroidia bacterium]
MKTLDLFENDTFEKVFLNTQWPFDRMRVFDDFLAMMICSVTRNPFSGKSYYEEEYLRYIEPYAKLECRWQFPKLFKVLTDQMTSLSEAGENYDVLGKFYEKHLMPKSSNIFFTPWVICTFMARSSIFHDDEQDDKSKDILDPACGSGRMLMAATRVAKNPLHRYYGVDIDPVCARMTALNLFLSGVFKGEVVCGDTLRPDGFRYGYRIYMNPIGIFKIDKVEKSACWMKMYG